MRSVDTVLQWGELTLPKSVLARSNSFLIQSQALQRSCGFPPQHSTRLAVYTPAAPALCSVSLGCAAFSRSTNTHSSPNTRSSQHSRCVTQAGTCHGCVHSLFRRVSVITFQTLSHVWELCSSHLSNTVSCFSKMIGTHCGWKPSQTDLSPRQVL